MAGCVSLFSGGGLGDAGVHYGAGVPVVASAELIPERADLIRKIVPSSAVFTGDIRDTKDALVRHVQAVVGRPWLLLMSPPCQAMTHIGARRVGDDRNRLILPALEVAVALRPDWVLIENVPQMRSTSIETDRGEELILDVVRRVLVDYTVEDRVLDTQHFGVPQHRERLFVVCARGNVGRDLHPCPTVAEPVTLERATGHLEPLDALKRPASTTDPMHVVPGWRPMVHRWMRHTPAGRSAFDNTTCVECGAEATGEAVSCQCGHWLARPRTEQKFECRGCGKRRAHRDRCRCGATAVTTVEPRLIKGFRKKIYRRMRENEPAPTLTTQSAYPSSEIKVHPRQHRVLSLREVLIVGSVAGYPGCNLPWAEACRPIEQCSPTTLRTIVGESIPPLMTATLVGHMLACKFR